MSNADSDGASASLQNVAGDMQHIIPLGEPLSIWVLDAGLCPLLSSVSLPALLSTAAA